VPVRVSGDPGAFDAEPVFGKSNLIFTLVRADGLVCIPAEANGLAAGTLVEVLLF
jgi:molybdopterin molybdotransferase